MVQITRDEMPLTDERKLRALVESLGIKKLKRKPLPPPQVPIADEEADSSPSLGPFDGPDELSRDARQKFEAYAEAAKRLSVHRLSDRPKTASPPFVLPPNPPSFLRDYFLDCVPRHVWLNGESIAVQVSFLESVLRRVVIRGLKNEREAKAVWLEATYHRASEETLEQVVERVVSDTEREAREYHRSFVHHLRFVRDYFVWRGDEAVPSAGRLLPIEKSVLTPQDIEVLRQVFMRLRYKSDKVPHAWYPALAIDKGAGSPKVRSRPVKKLAEARKRVKELSSDFADAGVTGWVDSCLVTKTEQWTRATPLFDHYRAWVMKGGEGNNRTERAEAKATALSIQKWGKLMRLQFPDGWRQDKRGILYRTAVKRGM